MSCPPFWGQASTYEHLPKDESEVIKWYQAAAEMGFMPACCLLAAIYKDRSDFQQQLKWEKKGALLGELDCLCSVRELYLVNNSNVGGDLVEAYAWLRAYEDDFSRPTNTEALATTMSSTQLAAAEELHKKLSEHIKLGGNLRAELASAMSSAEQAKTEQIQSEMRKHLERGERLLSEVN